MITRRARGQEGFAGLPELAVAVLLLGLLMPMLGLGLDNTWRLLTVVTARAAVGSGGVHLVGIIEAQLQGAQPLGYCASLDAPTPTDTSAPVGTPLSGCGRTGLGPPPPAGDADWSASVSPLTSPSTASCGTADLGQGALVTATSTCVGFFSYDEEQSGTSSSAGGALSDGGPFTPPDLTYLWRCVGPCTGPGGVSGLWLTTYAPTGSYTNAGCPSATTSCPDPDWSSAPSSPRYLGTVTTPTEQVFAYRDASGTPVPEDPATPPAVAADQLSQVDLVSVTVADAAATGSQAPATEVALTGNVYQSPTAGNG